MNRAAAGELITSLGYSVERFPDMATAETAVNRSKDIFITRRIDDGAERTAIYQCRLVDTDSRTTEIGFVAAAEIGDRGDDAESVDVLENASTVLRCTGCNSHGGCCYYWNRSYRAPFRTRWSSENKLSWGWDNDISSVRIFGTPSQNCQQDCRSSATSSVRYWKFHRHKYYSGYLFTLHPGEGIVSDEQRAGLARPWLWPGT